ncbi:YkvA family protein [Marinobacter sp. CHS3-4]|uniref:YkvA family protein n=1 Tax=Marinobacter sp. CHS3-4 TaxID=3045174 RepID=UPI0024B4AAC6|nr:YkvA family protein [Marinobacter sp. CHS3-4]MDI9246316.1 YkvA family protein [Marinobacter sp. CHS3-4]
MAVFNERKAKKQLDQEAGKVHQKDVGDLLARQKAIEEKVHNSGKLKRFSSDVSLMFSMLQDYWKGNYREIPWKSVAAIAGALIYVLNPLDVIPDLILGFGLVDDAGVVALCLKLVESDLLRYAAWKEHREQEEDTWISQP